MPSHRSFFLANIPKMNLLTSSTGSPDQLDRLPQLCFSKTIEVTFIVTKADSVFALASLVCMASYASNGTRMRVRIHEMYLSEC